MPFTVVPTIGSTAIMSFSSDNGASYAAQTALAPGTALFDFVVSAEGADAVSGVAKTQYRRQANPALPWTDAGGNRFEVLASDNAAETYDLRAVDNAGNASAAGSTTLKMDTIPPRTFGKSTTVDLGKKVAVKYKILDNLSPEAQEIVVKIMNAGGELVRTLAISGTKSTKVWHSFYWKPKHRGTYVYRVYAKDLAGNAQQTPVRAFRIIVK